MQCDVVGSGLRSGMSDWERLGDGCLPWQGGGGGVASSGEGGVDDRVGAEVIATSSTLLGLLPALLLVPAQLDLLGHEVAAVLHGGALELESCMGGRR